MTNLGIIALIILLVVVAALGYAVNRLVIAPNRKTLRYASSEEFKKDEIVREQVLTNFLGLESQSDKAPGLGNLVLSAKKLWFYRSDPPLTVDIALADITSVELAKTHMGQTTGRPLLLVRFNGASGPDSVAYHLPYPDEWRLAINNLR
jgi:hypothetical protein